MLDTTPKVTVIILHFENAGLLTECLKSFQDVTYPNYEIMIVRNGDRSDLTLPAMQEIVDRVVTTIDLPKNVGYARANNHGIQQAISTGADRLLLMNDDTSVSPDFLHILVEFSEKFPDIGMLGPAIYYFDEPSNIWFAGARFDTQTCSVASREFNKNHRQKDYGPIESDYITGCALMVKKEVVEKIGHLNESFFLYWEDVDWGLRATKAGFKNVVVPTAQIWHKISVSTGGPNSPLKTYHKTRSHLIMAKLHAPWALSRLQRTFFRDIAWLLLKSKDKNRMPRARAYLAAIKDYHLHRTGKGPHWLWEN
jgi:GT2 family glycosyltransferase